MSFKQTYGLLLLGYLAILPIAETIALRHLLMAILLVLLFCAGAQGIRSGRLQTCWSLRWHAAPLTVWVAFLVLFPLWAEQPVVAWRSLGSEWLMSIAAWCIGIGGAVLLKEKGPKLFALGGASMLLVGIHLLLTLLAWSGLLGEGAPSVISWREIFDALNLWLFGGEALEWRWQAFPWGFQGFDPMHGNLGYTETQAMALFSSICILAWSRREVSRLIWSGLAVVAGFLSVVIAMSRGAILYSMIVLGSGLLVYWGRLHVHATSDESQQLGLPTRANVWPRVLVGLMFGVFVLVLLLSAQKDPRWSLMRDKVIASFIVERPVDFLCVGITPEIEARVRQRFPDYEPERISALVDGLRGDGGRILVMRAGWQLVMQHPLGLDGSRHSFKKMMATQCGHTPALDFAHAHHGWIDLLLALGWLGGALYLWLLIHFLALGWRGLAASQTRHWALALILVALFWLLRGFTDAVYREHMLLMQAVLMGYLYVQLTTQQCSTQKSAKVAAKYGGPNDESFAVKG